METRLHRIIKESQEEEFDLSMELVYEVYTETLGVFPALEEAQSFLASQFKSVIDDDFYGNEENLNIYRTDSEFRVDNAFVRKTEKINYTCLASKPETDGMLADRPVTTIEKT